MRKRGSVYQRGKLVRQEVTYGHDGAAGVPAQVKQVAVAGEDGVGVGGRGTMQEDVVARVGRDDGRPCNFRRVPKGEGWQIMALLNLSAHNASTQAEPVSAR